jgi:hypothetical protein
MATQEQALEAGKALLNNLVAGKFEEIHKTFDQAMSEMMPMEGLKAAWAEIQVQAGKYEDLVGSKVATQDGYNVVLLTLKFERGKLLNRLVYNDKNQLAGLHFAPKE